MFRYLATVFAIAVLVVPAAQAHRSKPPQGPAQDNAVTTWSGIAQQAIVAPTPPATTPRPPASSEVLNGLVHAAIYDAVVSIEGRYEPFAVSIRSIGPTSVDSAVAAAARGVLVARVPLQAAAVDAQYTTYLAGIPDGTQKTNGIRLGRAVAGAYVALRSDDGFDNVVPWVQPPVGVGVFEPIPFTSTPVDIKLKQVRPLAFDDGSRFRPGGPYSVTSPRYAADFAEVKALGRSTGSTRTPEQTETAAFWTDQAMAFFNRGLRRLALQERLSTLESARMMAMANVSAADTLVGCWEAKYYYNFWRPQTAIQRADTDGNPATSPDPAWTHLFLGNHPEYPSGHACFTSALTRALTAYFGTDNVSFTLDSTVTGTSRTFDRLSDLRREVTLARIYGGLHFRKSMIDGDRLGKETTRYVLKHNFHELDD